MKTIKMNELSNWLVTYITDFIHGAQAENAPEFSKWAKSFKREEAEFIVRAEFVNDWGYDERESISEEEAAKYAQSLIKIILENWYL